jgi:Ni/Co efflux regulator RcnB
MIEVNSKLWKIEDDIRELERQKRFDDEFIQLARAVYITNDERFRRKNTINNYYNSSLVEVKSYKEY